MQVFFFVQSDLGKKAGIILRFHLTLKLQVITHIAITERCIGCTLKNLKNYGNRSKTNCDSLINTHCFYGFSFLFNGEPDL